MTIVLEKEMIGGIMHYRFRLLENGKEIVHSSWNTAFERCEIAALQFGAMLKKSVKLVKDGIA